MKPDYQKMAEDYLDGNLTIKESRAFEQALATEDAAGAFQTALVLREMLELEDVVVPKGLAGDISLQVQKKLAQRDKKPKSLFMEAASQILYGQSLIIKGLTFKPRDMF